MLDSCSQHRAGLRSQQLLRSEDLRSKMRDLRSWVKSLRSWLLAPDDLQGRSQVRWRTAERILFSLGVILAGVYIAISADAVILADLDVKTIEAEANANRFDANAHRNLPEEILAAAGLARNHPVAILKIPRLKLIVPINEGTDPYTLRRGLGRIRGTADIGEEGNIGIAGHRDSFFRGLQHLSVGDRIEIVSPRKSSSYIVKRIEIVWPNDVRVLGPREVSGITLVTCYPFNYIGRAPRRFVVEASAEELAKDISPQGDIVNR
jgi:sortase A